MRVRWPVIALALAIVVSGIYGCSSDNNKTTNPAPALTATITANPASPTTGSVVNLTVTPSPAGNYTVTWAADGGSFARTDTSATTWTAPDLDGTYQIKAILGDGTNAATAKKSIVVASYVPAVSPYYLGAKTCNGCHVTHGDTYTAWSNTLHAQAFQALGADSANINCIGCHTVGYDPAVANGGYDEQAVSRLASVQCENCHGPASAHVASGDNSVVMPINKSAALCGSCHDGEHHPTYTEWKGSPHARLVYEGPGVTPANNVGCAKCHNGNISMQYLDSNDLQHFPNPPQEAANDTSLTVACAVCHDPHGNGNAKQLRMASVSDVALPDGTIPAIGAGRLCIACHNGRRAPGSINDQVTNGNGHFGPHHSNQGDMLAGVDGYNNVNPSFHYATGRHVTVQDGCVNCHNHHRQDQIPFYTGHDFAPTPQACAFCHGAVTDFNDIKAKEDYDGNGVVEGMQTEVEGLMDTLATTIIDHSRDDTRKQELQTAYDGGTFDVAVGDSSISSRPQRAAGYNYFFVKWDGSTGVHNATYAIQLLQQSILSLRPTGLKRATVLVQ